MTEATQVYGSCKPLIQAGKTTAIHVAQTIDSDTNVPLLKVNDPSTVYIIVDGPRTQLTDADIAGVYPTPGSENSPEEFLPHIALTRRTLPWERDGVVAGQPWLALVLMKQSELGADSQSLSADQSSGDPVQAVKLSDLQGTDPKGYAQIVAQKPPLAADTDLNVLVMPQSMWKRVRPEKDDLPYLSYLKRQTPWQDGTEGIAVDTAVVIGSRLPDATPVATPGGDGRPEVHWVFLVSLEGRSDLYDDTLRADTANVALVVLHDWSFRPSTGGDFEEVMKMIRVRPNGGVLRFGNQAASGSFPTLLDTGGAIEVQHTRLDELGNNQHLAVHYHGPLVPLPPPARDNRYAISTALQEFGAAAGKPAAGPLDYSYAAAFELGRMLALGNQAILEDLHAVGLEVPVVLPNVLTKSLPPALARKDWGTDPGDDTYQEENIWQGEGMSLLKEATQVLGENPGNVTGAFVAKGEEAGMKVLATMTAPAYTVTTVQTMSAADMAIKLAERYADLEAAAN